MVKLAGNSTRQRLELFNNNLPEGTPFGYRADLAVYGPFGLVGGGYNNGLSGTRLTAKRRYGSIDRFDENTLTSNLEGKLR